MFYKIVLRQEAVSAKIGALREGGANTGRGQRDVAGGGGAAFMAWHPLHGWLAAVATGEPGSAGLNRDSGDAETGGGTVHGPRGYGWYPGP